MARAEWSIILPSLKMVRSFLDSNATFPVSASCDVPATSTKVQVDMAFMWHIMQLCDLDL